MKKKKCEICGWDKYVEKHHIIKRIDFGSDEEENIILLCPNHHWIADFGSSYDKALLLNTFKKLGKQGKRKSKEYIERIDNLIFTLTEDDFKGRKFSEKEKEKFREDYRYHSYKKILMNKYHIYHQKILKRAEILFIIKLLNQELNNLL